MSRERETSGSESPQQGPGRSLYGRIRPLLGAGRRRLRAWTNRILRPLHHRRTKRKLTESSPPRSVLFVCLGNVCRSPYAEARFRAMTGDDMPSRSVGFIGPDRPPPDEALRAARRRGLELSTHRSRVVEERDLQETDLVVLMDPSHGRRLTRHSGRFRAPVIALGDLDPEYDPPSRTIRDPWGRPPEFFEDVFSRIDRCLAELTGALGYPTKGNRNAEDASPTAKDGR